MPVQVLNIDNHHELAGRAELADNFSKRLQGLMFKAELLSGQGLIIQPCNMIHTHFMRFPIDALFLDGDKKILHIIESMPPWRNGPHIKGGYYVVELPAGTAQATETEVGHHLEWKRA